MPIITTVIPTYRRPQLLKRAVLSVLAQTYPNIQVCIYDNASDDETKSVVADLVRHDSRVKYHCHSHNIGSYNNFNYGIQEVNTPYFSLLSDDDFLVPDFYEKTMALALRFPSAGFYCTPTIVIDTNGKIISPPIQITETRLYQPQEGFTKLVDGTLPNTWTGIVFRQQVREEIGLIDTTVGPSADGGWVWKAGARFPFVVAPGIAAVLMAHKQSTSWAAEPISASWPQEWQKMIASAINGKKVSAQLKLQASALKSPNFKKIAQLQVLHYLAEGKTDLALRAAQGIGDCGYQLVEMWLRGVIQGYRIIPGSKNILGKIKTARKKYLYKNMYDVYHAKYSGVLNCLEKFSALK